VARALIASAPEAMHPVTREIILGGARATAADATLALHAARDLYTRRGEGISIWVVPSNAITASDPAEKGMMFEPAASKIYRHPTFYEVPEEVGHM